MTGQHDHGDHEHEEGSEEQNEDTSVSMNDDELNLAIEKTIKEKEQQRIFWDAELREMNRWLRL
eukprot:gene16644-8080_t